MTEKHDPQLPEQEDLGQETVDAVEEREGSHAGRYSAGKSRGASALLAAVVAGTVAAFGPGAAPWPARMPWLAFLAAVAYLIARTGRIGRWRALFFAVLAWGFTIHFKAESLGLGRSAFFTERAMEVPYCHIALASSFLNTLYYQYLAFRSGDWSAWGPLTLGALWLAVTLVIGQAWCSWACFYGGIDDGLSRLLRKPRLRWGSVPARLRDLPAAMLLFMMLASLASLVPAFCLWACPLKLTTAFLDPDTAIRKIQLALFAAIGLAGLVAVPLLAKKRLFCGLVCPFGAWQAFWGRVNPFRVAIRPEACTQCRLCERACPIFAIDADGLRRHEIGPYCNRCGECLDACPTGAIEITVLGRRIGPRGRGGIVSELVDARAIFVYAALVMGGTVGSLFIPKLLARFL